MKKLTLPLFIALAIGSSAAWAATPPAAAQPAPAAVPAMPAPPAMPVPPAMPEAPAMAMPEMPAYPGNAGMTPPAAPDFEAIRKEREAFMKAEQERWQKMQQANEAERQKMMEEHSNAMNEHMEKMRGMGMPDMGRQNAMMPGGPWGASAGGPGRHGMPPGPMMANVQQHRQVMEEKMANVEKKLDEVLTILKQGK